MWDQLATQVVEHTSHNEVNHNLIKGLLVVSGGDLTAILGRVRSCGVGYQ